MLFKELLLTDELKAKDFWVVIKKGKRQICKGPWFDDKVLDHILEEVKEHSYDEETGTLTVQI